MSAPVATKMTSLTPPKHEAVTKFKWRVRIICIHPLKLKHIPKTKKPKVNKPSDDDVFMVAVARAAKKGPRRKKQSRT